VFDKFIETLKGAAAAIRSTDEQGDIATVPDVVAAPLVSRRRKAQPQPSATAGKAGQKKSARDAARKKDTAKKAAKKRKARKPSR
jgi:topoisomerase IA-like protein